MHGHRDTVLSLNAGGAFRDKSQLVEFLSHITETWAIMFVQEIDKHFGHDQGDRKLQPLGCHYLARCWAGPGSLPHGIIVHRDVIHDVKTVRFVERCVRIDLKSRMLDKSSQRGITSMLGIHTPHNNIEEFYSTASGLLKKKSQPKHLYVIGDANADRNKPESHQWKAFDKFVSAHGLKVADHTFEDENQQFTRKP